MAIYRGYNTNFDLAEVVNKDEAISNLGLRVEDVNIITGVDSEDGRGISDFIDENELIGLANLEVDQKKQLFSLERSSGIINQIIDDLIDISLPLPSNLRLDDQLRAGAVKYSFYDYSTNSVKNADISTSRVSSWSSTDFEDSTAPIFYGGDLLVTPNPATSNTSNITVSGLKTLEEPQPKLGYDSIAPTHLLKLTVNGSEKEFYVMKGIPITYRAFFRDMRTSNPLTGESVTPVGFFIATNGGTGTPVFRIENVNDGRAYDSTASITSNKGSWVFRDAYPKPRDVKIYYNPKYITKLGIPNIKMRDMPNSVSMENLEYLNVLNNDLYQLPDFATITPSLKRLLANGNNMSRATDSNGNRIPANTQLQKLPSSLEHLHIQGCFSDSTPIDISTVCPNLRSLYMNAYYSRYSYRRMTGGVVTPSVSPTIQIYHVQHQPYTQLANTVMTSTNLTNIDIYACNITNGEGGGSVFLDSDNLVYYRSHSNSHNLVNVQGKELLEYYSHTHSRNLTGTASENDINNVFDSNNSALVTIHLDYTDAEGSIQSAFQNLTSLRNLYLQGTRCNGFLDDDSFFGTNAIEDLRIRYGTFNTNDFFGDGGGANKTGGVLRSIPNLRILVAGWNGNMGGTLPDFSLNTRLYSINISYAAFSGDIPAFNENNSLQYITLRDNNFSGGLPAYEKSSIRYIDVQGNNLSGDIPVLQCANLTRLRIQRNNFDGVVSDLSGCPRLYELSASNNQLSGYRRGSFASLTNIRGIDLSNNNLTSADLEAIILDMQDNLFARGTTKVPRVTVNLLGNPNMSIEDLPENVLEIYNNLGTVYGWSILV